MLHAFREWRRERVLGRAAPDGAAWEAVLAHYPFLRALDEDERARLRRWSVLFLDAKQLQGAAGLELDEAMKLAIAAQACLPILNLDLEYYAGWSEVIVYPGAFMPRVEYADPSGVVHVERPVRTGEAWLRGPVILSWAHAASGDDGGHVVIHEFAHKLDMLDGAPNGCPPLHRGMNRAAWSAALGGAYEDFRRRVDDPWDGAEVSAIDPYGAESPGEFFAVASEAFFGRPRALRLEYPAAYAQLALFYRQDPAARDSY